MYQQQPSSSGQGPYVQKSRRAKSKRRHVKAILIAATATTAASALALVLAMPMAADVLENDTANAAVAGEFQDLPAGVRETAQDAADLMQEGAPDAADLMQEGDSGKPQVSANATEACKHTWVAAFETVSYPAITHEINHAAEYEEGLAYHTICNECGEVLDGMASDHVKSTGHCGYTAEVPIMEPHLKNPAWTETVVDQQEHAETIQTAWVCRRCGESVPVSNVETSNVMPGNEDGIS